MYFVEIHILKVANISLDVYAALQKSYAKSVEKQKLNEQKIVANITSAVAAAKAAELLPFCVSALVINNKNLLRLSRLCHHCRLYRLPQNKMQKIRSC